MWCVDEWGCVLPVWPSLPKMNLFALMKRCLRVSRKRKKQHRFFSFFLTGPDNLNILNVLLGKLKCSTVIFGEYIIRHVRFFFIFQNGLICRYVIACHLLTVEPRVIKMLSPHATNIGKSNFKKGWQLCVVSYSS